MVARLFAPTLFVLCAGASLRARAETQYKLPPPEVVALVDAPVAPLTELDPQGQRLVQVEIEPNPPLMLLARPFRPLAGLRVDAALHARQRTRRNLRMRFIDLADARVTPVALPPDAHLSMPTWSPDGSLVAFGVDTPDGRLRVTRTRRKPCSDRRRAGSRAQGFLPLSWSGWRSPWRCARRRLHKTARRQQWPVEASAFSKAMS